MSVINLGTKSSLNNQDSHTSPVSDVLEANTAEANEPASNSVVVSLLYFLLAIPAIPGVFIIGFVLLGISEHESTVSFVNSLHFNAPAAVVIHGGSGFLLFLFLPLQFSPRCRLRFPAWHRMSGRIVVFSGYVMALSAIWMHVVLHPNAFGMRFYSLLIMSGAICLTLSIALWHIIHRRILAHNRWMMRSVAIILAAITPLFIDAMLYLLFGQMASVIAVLSKLQFDYGRFFAIVINIAVVEWIMARKKM